MAYLSVPLFAGPVVRRFGYRSAAMVGLSIMAIGDQLMGVGAQKLSLPFMCGAHFFVGVGVATLERCANAYVVECGPRSRATLRILIAQSAAALGTVLAPPIATAAIFDASKGAESPTPDHLSPGRCLMPPPPARDQAGDLSKVVTFYRFLGLGVLGLVLVLGAIFFRTRLVIEPHVPVSPELEHSKLKFWKHPLASKQYLRLWLGVGGNFLNLGCQVTVAQFFIEHVRVNACQTDIGGSDKMMIAQILFLCGRLVAAGLIELPSFFRCSLVRKIFESRQVLSVFVALAAVFTGLGIVSKGTMAVGFACLVMFFEAPTFPMIFEAASAGLGEWTPTAESLIILSISGGGIVPIINGQLADQFGVSKSWSLATALFGMVFSYTLLCNVIPSFKHALDAAHEEEEMKPSDVELAEQSA